MSARVYSRSLVAGAALLLGAVPLAARGDLSVRFELQPAVVRAGETATAAFTVRGVRNPPAPELPEADGLRVQPVGTERRMSLGPGGGDSAVVFRYAVVPLRHGDFRIGPFRYTAAGESVEVAPVTLKVVDGDESAGGRLEDLVFARLEMARTNVFVQESFDLDLVLGYRRLNLARDISLVNLPEAGLKLQPFQEMPAGREEVDGAVYEMRRFRTRVRAVTAGTFRLSPTLRLQALVRSGGGGMGPFGDPFFQRFFGADPFSGGVGRHPFNVTIAPVEVTVRPLPEEGRPPSFSGAVGRFEFEADVKPREVPVGEPVTLTMTVTGRGNPDAVSAPAVEVGDAFRAYEAKLASRDVDEARGLGRKSFEQVLLPRSEQVSEVPAVAFSFFDPAAAAYRTITRGPFPLVVHPSTNGGMRIVMSAPPSEPAVRGEDIVYLKPAPKNWRRADTDSGSLDLWLLGLCTAAPVVLLGLYGWTRRRERLLGDEARRRRERAPRAARAALRRADAAARAGDEGAFYEAVWAALRDYFGDRLNLPPGEVTEEGVNRALRQAGAPETMVNEATELFAWCERRRFGAAASAAASTDALRADRARAGRLLRGVERYRLT